jgi:hypothetical protein
MILAHRGQETPEWGAAVRNGETMRVLTGELCPRCDTGEWAIETEAAQDPDAAWTAYDGDEAVCDACGMHGWVSVDDGDAWIGWDDSADDCDPGDADGDHASALESAYGPEE